MTFIGVSGHQRLPEVVRAHVERELRAFLSGQAAPVTGVTSLAEGADQLFAEAVLDVGGALHVVVPARGYEEQFEDEAGVAYRRLLAAAERVTTLDYDVPNEAAYHAAGRLVVDRCDLLVAVWDSEPARGLGGTGDAVAYARESGREVLIIWPDGIRR